jgi:uncharacterized phosphatase
MTNTYLGLLRHGQTDWNIDLRLQGTTDIPMNETGIAQITKAAEVISKSDWDIILTSPLGRAVHSAELVKQRIGEIELEVEPLLLERSFGIGEGMTYAEWQKDFADLDHIPGAESRLAVEKRSAELLDHLIEKYSGAKILAVSHGALIRSVISNVSLGEIPPKGERLQNASLHKFHHTEIWNLEGWAPDPLA